MENKSELGEAFEANRAHLIAVARRMLGSDAEAQDAVQDAWFRVDRSDLTDVENLGGWLTTVVSRICLDRLRSRAAHPVDLVDEPVPPLSVVPSPEQEAELADSVGAALMVVLETLTPAERLAFVLHDLFAIEFEQIGEILGRSPVACRQLASRARRRVSGHGDEVEADRVRQREVVTAFLDASRNGHFEALLTLLHPDARVSSNAAALAMGTPEGIAGRQAVADFFNGRAKAARLSLLDSFACATWSHRGEVKVVFGFTVEDGVITQIEFLAGEMDKLDLVVRA